MPSACLGLALIGLEGHLKHPITQGITVEGLDRNQGFIIVGHSNKSKSLALIGLKVANDLDTLHSAERTEKLPQ